MTFLFPLINSMFAQFFLLFFVRRPSSTTLQGLSVLCFAQYLFFNFSAAFKKSNANSPFFIFPILLPIMHSFYHTFVCGFFCLVVMEELFLFSKKNNSIYWIRFPSLISVPLHTEKCYRCRGTFLTRFLTFLDFNAVWFFTAKHLFLRWIFIE